MANSDFNPVAYAERVAEMTDAELLEEGKQLRSVVYPKRIFAEFLLDRSALSTSGDFCLRL